jgi:G:T-mismatch repair DNA endonuclease (very short patch repair protein)
MLLEIWWEKVMKICLYCGMEFEGRICRKYCSFSCQQKAFKKRSKEHTNPLIICPICGKETYNNKYCSRKCICIAMNRPGIHKNKKGIRTGQIPWNKGLTKEDPRVKEATKKSGQTQKSKFASGEIKPHNCFGKGHRPWNTGLTKENDDRLAQYSERTSSRMLRLWKNSEFVQKQMVSRGTSPNAVELELEQKLIPFGFRFVGDGKLIIGGKCPDYCDNNSHLIELHGDYWHKGQDPQDRIDYFKQFGYDTLIIWEHELNGEIDLAILEFIGNVDKNNCLKKLLEEVSR